MVVCEEISRRAAAGGGFCLSSQRHAGKRYAYSSFESEGPVQDGGCPSQYKQLQRAMSPSTIHDVRRVYKIASIPADGIGPEVISAGIQVLHKLAAVLSEFEFHFEHFDWSSETYKKTGQYLPNNGLESLKKYNAILFGAVGDRGPCPLSDITFIASCS